MHMAAESNEEWSRYLIAGVDCYSDSLSLGLDKINYS